MIEDLFISLTMKIIFPFQIGRRFDQGSEVKDLSILTLHHWGENPKGTWTIRLRNVEPNATKSGMWIT